MSEILVITPIYKIVGRKELERDSECVHDLIKYWTDENHIHVIFPYVRRLRDLVRFFLPSQLRYYLNGCNYVCDNIPVTVLERQNIVHKQATGLKSDISRFGKIVKKELDEKKFNPDIIIVHIPCASKYFIDKIDYTCKKIAVLHYSDLECLRDKGQEFVDFLNNKFEAVFCRSQSIYNECHKYNLKNLRKEIIFSGAPNIIEDKEIINSKFKQQKTQILYVGKLIKRKNLDILIKALSKVDNSIWNLKVIGQGKMQKKYKKLVNQLDLNKNIDFLGKLSREMVLEYMEKADIFCMPSVNETVGIVYLEAMSKGCITIAIKNEGIDGVIVDKDNGYLVNVDENEIASLISDIIEDRNEERRTISKRAIETAQYYNEKNMSDNYYSLIKKEINN